MSPQMIVNSVVFLLGSIIGTLLALEIIRAIERRRK